MRVVFGRLAIVVTGMIRRRQLQWVEISVVRAWSRDMAPRLFDVGK